MIRRLSLMPLILAAAVGTVSNLSTLHAATPQETANQILKESGVQGGLIVHIGIGNGELTTALKATESYQVHGLDTDAAIIGSFRSQLTRANKYGPITADRFDGKRLPYIDNLLNLIVTDDLGEVQMKEVLRVLAPEGVVMVAGDNGWVKTVKPRPDDIDEWTHYLHDASGNAVAHDQVVGPPRHLQWVGSPRWARHHDRMASMSALVSAGGRIFYIMDEGSRVSIQLPPRWTLIARDAFNGTILWKRPIASWQNHLWPLKSGPTQLARRLVAIDDRVYITLGYRAPLVELDASNGKTLRTFEESNPTEEVVVASGVLFALVNKGIGELDEYAPQLNVGDQARVRKDFAWNEKERSVVAYDLQTGKMLWKRDSKVAPLTLSADDQNAFIHDGEKVVALDRYTGNIKWASYPVTRRSKMTMNFGPKLVVQNGVLMFAGGDKKMTAFDASSGESLWTSPHAQSGYQSPEDLLIINGIVWNAPTTSGKDTGTFTGRDIKTGETKAEFDPDVDTYWFHHRCYIAKATDRFLMPSRTGIEFVDTTTEHWDINHWVRGGCLYGVMPCNGLTYAPPHNCACYPEAKLYGMNALAPLTKSRIVPDVIDETGRLEVGSAYNAIDAVETSATDWPTYRHDRNRSGFTNSEVSPNLQPGWETKLGGRLTSVVIANGQLYVSQIDQHTLYALDASSGEQNWAFTAGGRIDSPPTVWQGRVLFGSADGWVYCLRATDGALAWRFRAAPMDMRLTAYEQLESVWPVHGSVLVDGGSVYCVAGRSNFLDNGLRWLKLDARTGEKQVEQIIDEKNPNGEGTLQDQLEVLQMAVGLPDILSSDEKYVYMRSQRFDRDGNRYEVGPNSGDFAGQAAVHHGEGPHLFAPMGFLDDTWFHRSYWVYGKSFAGGHAGYFQAGRYAPSGRILVNDEHNVYGFGRKPEYLKWTTIIEHQLFSAPKEAPIVPERLRRRGVRNAASSMVAFENTNSIDPTGKAIAVEAWVKADRPSGVVVAHGGPTHGYALILKAGKPQWIYRAAPKVYVVAGGQKVTGKWTHLVGQVTSDKKLQLFVNGKLAASGTVDALIPAAPAQSLQIGADDATAVGDYKSPNGFTGLIDNVRVYHGTLSVVEVADAFENPGDAEPKAPAVIALSFDRSDTTDESGNENHGVANGTRVVRGHAGMAMQFTGRAAGGSVGNKNSFVQPHWTKDVPLLVRAMLKSKDTLFIAGPPDIVDEVETFQLLTQRDKAVEKTLARQEAILDGKEGAVLRAVSAIDGTTQFELHLSSLPVWDSLAAAGTSLFLTTTDGRVVMLNSK
jgi:outer membrane protein assembly factor BamB